MTSNRAFVTAETLLDAELLIRGAIPLNTLSLFNLSSVAQAVVLHESVIPTVDLELDVGTPLIDALTDSGFLDRGDTTFFAWNQRRQGPRKSFTFVYPDPRGPAAGHRVSLREALINLIESDPGGMSRRLADRDMHNFRPDVCDVSEAVFAWADFARQHGLQLVADVLWSPLLYTQLVRTSVPADLYGRVARQFELNADLAFRNLGLRRLPIPPLGALLLERCANPADIPRTLVELREEFAGLRRVLSDFDDRLSQAGTLREKLEVRREVDAEWDRVARKMVRPRHTASWWLWSAIEFGVHLVFRGTAALEDALTAAISHIRDNPPRIRLQGFVDIYDQATNTRYHELAQRVFGGAVRDADLRAHARFSQATAALLQVGQTQP